MSLWKLKCSVLQLSFGCCTLWFRTGKVNCNVYMMICLNDSHVEMQTSKLIPAFCEFLVFWHNWFLSLKISVIRTLIWQSKKRRGDTEGEENIPTDVVLELVLQVTWHRTAVCDWRMGVEMQLLQEEWKHVSLLADTFTFFVTHKMLCK